MPDLGSGIFRQELGYPYNVLQALEDQCRSKGGRESYEPEGAFTNAQAHQLTLIDLHHQSLPYLRLEGLPQSVQCH